MTRIFLTGFPGFLARHLLPELLLGADDGRGEDEPRAAVCLVEPRMAEQARTLVRTLEERHPSLAGRIELLEGDLTRPGVLVPGVALGRVDRAYHLAAAYTLDVDRETAMAVNVQGTRHLLDLLRDRSELQCLHHVSTCYVSGRHPGVFREGDLDVEQPFGNHYEETKFLAEMEVRRAAREGLPVAVYRPAVVTGDSRTGSAEKKDGLYYLLGWIQAQGRLALVPRVPGQGRSVFNVVPSDFVVSAMARLSEREESVGRTFHLADPDPLPVNRLVKLAAQALEARPVPVPMPLLLAKAGAVAAGRLPGFPRVPPQAMAHLNHPTRYATDETRPHLEEVGLEVPPLPSYLPRLAAFVRARGRGASRSPTPSGPGGLTGRPDPPGPSSRAR